jgi:hypothetical protein
MCQNVKVLIVSMSYVRTNKQIALFENIANAYSKLIMFLMEATLRRLHTRFNCPDAFILLNLYIVIGENFI